MYILHCIFYIVLQVVRDITDRDDYRKLKKSIVKKLHWEVKRPRRKEHIIEVIHQSAVSFAAVGLPSKRVRLMDDDIEGSNEEEGMKLFQIGPELLTERTTMGLKRGRSLIDVPLPLCGLEDKLPKLGKRELKRLQNNGLMLGKEINRYIHHNEHHNVNTLKPLDPGDMETLETQNIRDGSSMAIGTIHNPWERFDQSTCNIGQALMNLPNECYSEKVSSDEQQCQKDMFSVVNPSEFTNNSVCDKCKFIPSYSDHGNIWDKRISHVGDDESIQERLLKTNEEYDFPLSYQYNQYQENSLRMNHGTQVEQPINDVLNSVINDCPDSITDYSVSGLSINDTCTYDTSFTSQNSETNSSVILNIEQLQDTLNTIEYTKPVRDSCKFENKTQAITTKLKHRNSFVDSDIKPYRMKERLEEEEMYIQLEVDGLDSPLLNTHGQSTGQHASPCNSSKQYHVDEPDYISKDDFHAHIDDTEHCVHRPLTLESNGSLGGAAIMSKIVNGNPSRMSENNGNQFPYKQLRCNGRQSPTCLINDGFKQTSKEMNFPTVHNTSLNNAPQIEISSNQNNFVEWGMPINVPFVSGYIPPSPKTMRFADSPQIMSSSFERRRQQKKKASEKVYLLYDTDDHNNVKGLSSQETCL